MLVSPSLPSAYDIGSGAAEPLRFLGFITVSGYQGSVLPAFVTGIITAKFEKWLRRHVPDAIDLIVTPFITLLVGIMIALFALGPILHSLESVVLIVVENLLNLPIKSSNGYWWIIIRKFWTVAWYFWYPPYFEFP